MEFLNVIKERYSTTKFDGRPVEREQLEKILAAAMQAPTACNMQPQRMFVLESAEALAKMDQVSSCRYGASTIVMVCADRKAAFGLPSGFNFFEQDASIVATHILLAATNEGVDNIWTGIADRDAVRKAFDLEENMEPVAFLDLGYRAENDKPRAWHSQRKSFEETTKFL